MTSYCKWPIDYVRKKESIIQVQTYDGNQN